MCLRYVELERKIGEIDRARAIFAHCSNLCNPDIHKVFWESWKEFETEHGNEDTIREMLRVKRQVAATHNTQVNYMAAAMLAQNAEPTGTTADLVPQEEDDGGSEMRILEQKAAKQAAQAAAAEAAGGIRFVASSTNAALKKSTAGEPTAGGQKNTDEIDIDDSDSDEEPVAIQKQAVPSAVFGKLDEDERTN